MRSVPFLVCHVVLLHHEITWSKCSGYSGLFSIGYFFYGFIFSMLGNDSRMHISTRPGNNFIISVHCLTWSQVPPLLKSIFIFRTLTPNESRTLTNPNSDIIRLKAAGSFSHLVKNKLLKDRKIKKKLMVFLLPLGLSDTQILMHFLYVGIRFRLLCSKVNEITK